jgi:hypothetical protein
MTSHSVTQVFSKGEALGDCQAGVAHAPINSRHDLAENAQLKAIAELEEEIEGLREWLGEAEPAGTDDTGPSWNRPQG